MVFLPFTHNRALTLGSSWLLGWRRVLRVPLDRVKTHAHVIGKQGSGKSRFLAGLCLELWRHRLPFTLLDPHGDLAQLVLAHLVARGVYRDERSFERILYLDLPAAERHGRYLPFNVLAQAGPADAVAANVKEAFHRAWPELSEGAATFDTLLPDAVLLLLHNDYPITAMHRLLIDDGFREELLQGERDEHLIASFRNVYDKLRKPDQVAYAGSVLRRARQLTQAHVLRYGLGQRELALDYRRILDSGTSLIVNLALPNPDARRLLGCFLTVAAEQGALSRADITAGTRHGTHHLILDEFSEFTAQTEAALSRMLSLTRKFGLFLVMAHQTWSQASDRLRGALQNVDIDVVFRVGREDAERTARLLGTIDFASIKHEVSDEGAKERTHPLFLGLAEQWEQYTEQLLDLWPQEAFVALHNVKRLPWPWRLLIPRTPRRVVKVKTMPVPDPRVNADELAAVEEAYLRRYFRSLTDIEPERTVEPASERRGSRPRVALGQEP